MKTAVLAPLETTWEAWVLGGGAAASFERADLPLDVEIGPGEDDFLLRQALAHPEHNWLGIEYSRKRVHRYVRKVLHEAGPLGNLRLIWRPAADLVRPFLAPARVQGYTVLFPDPWPKKHHHRYRLLDRPFLEDVGESLVEGGTLRLLTDHLDYAEAIAEAAAGVESLEPALPAPGFETVCEGTLPTVFEARWRAQGKEIHHLVLRRKGVRRGQTRPNPIGPSDPAHEKDPAS
ncbi:MAG: tRNA (guanosine(46)-N(7))-methyltransferase TrmB [Planctomycetota bacterium]